MGKKENSNECMTDEDWSEHSRGKKQLKKQEGEMEGGVKDE